MALWHKSAKTIKTFSITAVAAADEETQNEYIQARFDAGYSRIWDEIQKKMSVYLSHSQKLYTLKYEQFIQVLSIVQRLCKVGMEFCSEPSTILMDSMKMQSIKFFQRYHLMCLDEICLFLDNEAWMPVHSFSDLLQLQEFNSVKSSLQRFQRRKHRAAIVAAANTFEANETTGARLSPSKRKKSYENNLNAGIDDTMSTHSQEDCSSSVYGSCGYFLKFSEKSSPFDGGFDEAMLEEDILAGIADESSCYFSEESEEEQNQDATADTDTAGGNALKSNVTVNNSSLNVLRCIGRYLQMCKLLHSISPEIVKSMTELVDFYIYVVHEYFARDMVSTRIRRPDACFHSMTLIFFLQPLSSENLYSPLLRTNLDRISSEILPKVRNWSSSHTLVRHTHSIWNIRFQFLIISIFQMVGSERFVRSRNAVWPIVSYRWYRKCNYAGSTIWTASRLFGVSARPKRSKGVEHILHRDVSIFDGFAQTDLHVRRCTSHRFAQYSHRHGQS